MIQSKQGKNNAPIIIAGSGRSGTTWVLDAIARANNLRTIFEPLHPIGVPHAKPFANRYVRDHADEPDLKLFIDKVFSGTLNSLWANYRLRPDRLYLTSHNKGSLRHRLGCLKYYYGKLISRYLRYHKVKTNNLIVKFIRANLMLGWLSNNYRAKILLVVRHPCAVIASKMRLGGPDWNYHHSLQQYLHNTQLVEDYLHKFKGIDMPSLSPVLGHTLIWCIENTLAMNHAAKYGHCIAYYENLIAYSDTEWPRVIASLELKYVPDKEFLSQPSQQVSREKKETVFDRSQIDSWMGSFAKQQLNEIANVLTVFGVSAYNTLDSMPK